MKPDVTPATESLIAALEKGVRPWMQPWNADYAAGKNQPPLAAQRPTLRRGECPDAVDGSHRQRLQRPDLDDLPASPDVRRTRQEGRTRQPAVYANTFTKTETNDQTGEDEEKEIPFLKGYTVFNVEQIEGLPAHYYAIATLPLEAGQRDAAAERFFKATGADIRAITATGSLRRRPGSHPNAAL